MNRNMLESRLRERLARETLKLAEDIASETDRMPFNSPNGGNILHEWAKQVPLPEEDMDILAKAHGSRKRGCELED